MATVNFILVAGNIVFEADVSSSDNTWFDFFKWFKNQLPKYLVEKVATCDEYQLEYSSVIPERPLTEEEMSIIDKILYGEE